MPKQIVSIDIDAFSSGQVGSKKWLCDVLENINHPSPLTVWIYGGWHGILSFMLLSRNAFKIHKIRSFDIDPTCEPIADIINENWVWRNWQFKAFTRDCNILNPQSNEFGDTPNLVINTSAEHMGSIAWFENLPKGIMVIVQSNDMAHDDHKPGHSSLDDFDNTYPMHQVLFLDQLEFDYKIWKFNRFMKIGIV